MFRKNTKSSAKKFSAIPTIDKATEVAKSPAKEVKPTKASAAVPSEIVVAKSPAVVAESAKSDNTTAVANLVVALRNSDADVARDAAISLGALGNAAAVQPLIDVLVNADGYFHSVVRAAAAGSLAQLRDPRAVESLIGAIRDPLAEPSAEAIRALAAIGDLRAVAPLIEVVRNSNGYFLPIARRAAVVALSCFKSEPAAAEVLAVSRNESEDVVIRDAAKEAIAGAAGKRSAR